MIPFLVFVAVLNTVKGSVSNSSSVVRMKPNSMYERLPLMDRLLQNYDKRVRPGYGTSKPVDNYVNIFVNSFGAISAQTMDYKINIFLRQRWIDPRLQHDAEGLNFTFLSF